MAEVAVAGGAAFLVLILLLALSFLWWRSTRAVPEEGDVKQAHANPAQQAAPAMAPAAVVRQGAADRMRAGMRQRLANRAQAAAAGAGARAHVEGSESDSSSGDDPEDGQAGGRAGGRRARREAREAEQALQEAKSNKSSAYDDRRRAREAQREAQEEAQEAEMKRAREETRKAEEAEATKWMKLMKVEQQGTGVEEAEKESAETMNEFVDYIKARKAVPLDTLALEFGLRTTDAIDRIHAMEEAGRLTGVMDDRGKYIYISLEEMGVVARYITSRGRIAISELAAKSNTFIDLELKTSSQEAGAAAPTIEF